VAFGEMCLGPIQGASGSAPTVRRLFSGGCTSFSRSHSRRGFLKFTGCVTTLEGDRNGWILGYLLLTTS